MLKLKKYYLVYFPELEHSLSNNVTQGYSFASAVYMGFDFLSLLFSQDNYEDLEKLCDSIHKFDDKMSYLDKYNISMKLLNQQDYLDKNEKVQYTLGIPMHIEMDKEFRETIE